MSTIEGLHVPVTPFVDVVDKVGTVLPEQIEREVPKLNVGVSIGLTVTVNVVVAAHCPAFGVNVYTPEVVLLTTDGLHAPVIPFVDVVGKVGTTPPLQIVSELPKVNAGVIVGFTVTVNVAGTAHWPASAVNVYTPEAVVLTTAGLHVPVSPSFE